MTPEWLVAAQPYLALIRGAEDHYGVPPNLLVRIAWQESSFRAEVINGTVKSEAGCVGMFQLNPVYYPNAGKSIAVDASTAAQLLVQLYQRFQDWQVAVCAYDWGQGNVHHDIAINGRLTLTDMPEETRRYLTDIVADVPIPGSLV